MDGLWQHFQSPPPRQLLPQKDGVATWQGISIRMVGEATIRQSIRRSGRALKPSHRIAAADQIDGSSDRPRSADRPRRLLPEEVLAVLEDDDLPPSTAPRVPFDRTALGGHSLHSSLRSRSTPASTMSTHAAAGSGRANQQPRQGTSRLKERLTVATFGRFDEWWHAATL